MAIECTQHYPTLDYSKSYFKIRRHCFCQLYEVCHGCIFLSNLVVWQWISFSLCLWKSSNDVVSRDLYHNFIYKAKSFIIINIFIIVFYYSKLYYLLKNALYCSHNKILLLHSDIWLEAAIDFILI